jgi:hypothetical protein
MDNSAAPNPESVKALPEPEVPLTTDEKSRRITIIIVVIAFLALIIILGTFLFLMRAPAETVAQMRDVFIIFLSLLSLLIGLALVILMIQLARLINLLQNEIKPIIESTNETVSNLRGTTEFLSGNIVEPVIRMNEYLAGLTELLAIIGITRKPKKPSNR